jgi:excisionase family DNA binding protein
MASKQTTNGTADQRLGDLIRVATAAKILRVHVSRIHRAFDLIRVSAAAKNLRVHVSCIHRAIKNGRIRGWRHLSLVYVSKSEIDRLMQPVEPDGR